MTHKAFIVALPVTGPGTTNDISAIVPARFQHVVAGDWNIIYSEPAPIMQPDGTGAIVSRVGGRLVAFPRTRDTRAVLFLRAIAWHVAQSMAAFVATSEDVRFLRWAYDKATAAGYETWTQAQLLSDMGPRATYIRNNADSSDLAAIQRMLAGMDSGAMGTTVPGDIANAVAIDSGAP